MVLMLSRLRILALFALLCGVVLLVAGAFLPRFLPADEPTPLDLNATTISFEDPAATVGPAYLQGRENSDSAGAESQAENSANGADQETGGVDEKAKKAPVVRQFHMTQGAPADDKEASGRVGVSTRRDDVDDDLDALLDAQVFTFRVDRHTGEVVGKTGQVADTPATPPTETPMEGNWVKFPQKAEQTSYDYFDYTLRKAYPAEFVREETRTDSFGKDVKVYVYKQEIEPTKVADSYEGFRNEIALPDDADVTVAEGEPQVAHLYHSVQRELVVEPQTGLLVGGEEHTTDEYMAKDADGKLVPVQMLLDFHGKTTSKTESRMLAQAGEMTHTTNSRTWSLALIAAGVIVSAVSLFFVFRSTKRKKIASA